MNDHPTSTDSLISDIAEAFTQGLPQNVLDALASHLTAERLRLVGETVLGLRPRAHGGRQHALAMSDI